MGSEPGNKEYTEVETKQNSAKISDEESTEISNKASDASTEISKKFICEECGKPFDTKKQT